MSLFSYSKMFKNKTTNAKFSNFPDNNKPKFSLILHFVLFRWFSAVHKYFQRAQRFSQTGKCMKYSQCSLCHNTFILSVYILIRMAVYMLCFVLLCYCNLHSYTARTCAATEISLCRAAGDLTVVKVPLYSNFPHAFRMKNIEKWSLSVRALSLSATYRWWCWLLDQFDCQFERRHAWGSIVSVCAVAATSIRLCPYMRYNIVGTLHSIKKNLNCVCWTYTRFWNIIRFVFGLWFLRSVIVPLELSRIYF